jgi:guanylate cyclase
MWARVVNLVVRIGDDPDDTLEIRIQKRVLVAVSTVVGLTALLWGALYFVFDEPLAASIPWTYALGVGVSLLVFAVTGRYRVFRFTQLFLILLLPFMLQLALGGFADGSAVIIWSLLAPLGALAMWGRRWWLPKSSRPFSPPKTTCPSGSSPSSSWPTSSVPPRSPSLPFTTS